MVSTLAGEFLTHWTVRAAFGLYVLALAVRLSVAASPGRERVTRLLWTLGWMAFLVHVACAFHFFHHWSHADAYRETARQTAELTGVASGAGLYLNYAFLLAWTVDVARAWRPGGLSRRPRWIAALLHAFFAFMWFNATVIFPTGAVRWAGAAGFGLLIVLLLLRGWKRTGNAEAMRPRG